MKVIDTVGGMRSYSAAQKREGQTLAFVPTMGYLHEGHLELVKVAKGLCDKVVVSVFVNPLQFGPNEDFARYPRDIERDKRLCEGSGVDAFFMPSADVMYPGGESVGTKVEVEGLSEKLCGKSRPGHFKGVTTVVTKLFNIVAPDKAVFGLKDYQQQLIIRRMVVDLNMDIEIVSVPTVREADGLAMSSRNKYLSTEERLAARAIPAALDAASLAFGEGDRKAGVIIEKMRKIMAKEPLVMVEYLHVCSPETLDDIEDIKGRALVAVAVKVGNTRLIDNRVLEDSGPRTNR
ncbi:MAG: pantoate--beta-alanine ligase [Deltaproteobacteria bacterium]|nr:pantoate--beta-alanine ligase [Deltaproteobacteria bacterium]